MTRISLYKHELEVIERLTINLVRMTGGNLDINAAIIGPEIFARLLDALYARGKKSDGYVAFNIFDVKEIPQ